MQADVCKEAWGSTPPAQGSAEWMAETQQKLFNTLAQLHKAGNLSVENFNIFSRMINLTILNEFDQMKNNHLEQLILPWISDIVRTRSPSSSSSPLTASPPLFPTRSTSSPSILSLKASASTPTSSSSFLSSPTLLPLKTPASSPNLVGELSPNKNNAESGRSGRSGSGSVSSTGGKKGSLKQLSPSVRQLNKSFSSADDSHDPCLSPSAHISSAISSPIPISSALNNTSSSSSSAASSAVSSWSSSLSSSSPSEPFFSATTVPSSLLVPSSVPFERASCSPSATNKSSFSSSSTPSASSSCTPFHSVKSSFSLRNLFSFTNSSPLASSSSSSSSSSHPTHPSHPSLSSEDETDTNAKSKHAKKITMPTTAAATTAVTATPTIHLPRPKSTERERNVSAANTTAITTATTPTMTDDISTYENRQFSSENLIKILLSPDHEQVDFRSVYMLSFRSFISSFDLLNRIFFYYDNPHEVIEEREITENIAQTIRLKVISLLNYWLKTYFLDFTPELRELLHKLIEERIKIDPECKSLITLYQILQRLEGSRRDSVERDKLSSGSNSNGGTEDKRDKDTDESGGGGGLRPRSGPSGVSSTASYISSTSSVFNKGGPSGSSSSSSSSGSSSGGGRSPASSSSKGLRRSRSLDVLEVAPCDLARELTLLDFELFKRIMPIELTDQAWKRQPEKAANVVAFIQAFNDRAQWVAGELLARTKINERTSMKERFIDTAFECLKLENFHTTFAIMAAMTQHAVHRLKDLQGALGPAHERIADQLRTLTSSSDNYKTYRAVFKSALQNNRTCLPHLGVTLKNLTLYQASTPYEQQHKVIDVNRLVLVASEITHIEECTKRTYSFVPDPELRRKVRRALEKFAGKTDDELIARSMALEPKMTWQQYNQKVCLDVLHEEGFL